MPDLLIYGATGYTGRLASFRAKEIGLSFCIGGRTESKLKILAETLGVAYYVFGFDNTTNSNDNNNRLKVDALLSQQNIRILLNCAGPFIHTAAALADACIRSENGGVHYLDVSAEIETYKMLQMEERYRAAIEKGVMLLPGCGGSVAMLGCLVGGVVEGYRDECEKENGDVNMGNGIISAIEVALRISGPVSRGTATTMALSSGSSSAALRRVDGKLVEFEQATTATTTQFDFDNGEGPVPCFPVTLPDLVTIFRCSGVGNIATFAHIASPNDPNAISGSPTSTSGSGSSSATTSPSAAELPTDGDDGPTAEERRLNPYHAAVKLLNKDGAVVREAALHSVNGYTFTYLASVEAARRILAGELEREGLKGFRTPVEIFGSAFIEAVAGSWVRNLI